MQNAQDEGQDLEINRFGRIRKTNVKYNDYQPLPADVRSVFHAKPQVKKKKPVKSVQTSSSNVVPKKIPSSTQIVPAVPDQKPSTSYEKKQHAIEENVIARTSALKEQQTLRWTYSHRLLPDGAQPCLDIPSGVKKSIKESTKLLTDWSQYPARYIGKTCKVYWDGDRTWFYARIIYYDSNHDKHFVYYLSDATAEWLCLKDERIMVAEGIVLIKKGSTAWPALQYWVSPNARDVVTKLRAYKKGHEYVEYFAETTTGKRDYEFVQKVACRPINEAPQLLSDKRASSQSFERTMEQALAEQTAIDTTIHNVLSFIRKNVFIIISGENWIGTRVRAATRRIDWDAVMSTAASMADQRRTEQWDDRKVRRASGVDVKGPTIKLENIITAPRRRDVSKERQEEQDIIGTGRSIVVSEMTAERAESRHLGTIAQYCPSLDQHLIVFDEDVMQPQWISVGPETVDILIGPPTDTSIAGPSTAYLRSQTEKPEKKYCDMCGCGQEHVDETNINVDLKNVLQTCAVCTHSYHPYCCPKAPPGEPYGEVHATKPLHVLQRVNADYKRQQMASEEEMQGISAKREAQLDSVCALDEAQTSQNPFICWKCIPCDICGPAGSAWNRPHHCWKLSRAQDHAPEDPRSLCGECIWRFKHQKDFCPICFKLYPPDDAMPSHEMVVADSNISQSSAAETRALDVSHSSSATSSVVRDRQGADEQSEEAPDGQITSAANNDNASNTSGAEVTMKSRTTTVANESEYIIIKEDTDAMVQCNECNRWVHALCEGIDQVQYEAMTRGTHPVWGDEYLCPICRVSAAKKVIVALGNLDKTSIFAMPVTEAVAKNYYDIVRNPMDLKTMSEKAERGQYKSLQSLRQDFELMCLNALTFNKEGDEYWLDAWAFHELGLRMFQRNARQTKMSTYGVELDTMAKAIQQKRDEAKRVEKEDTKNKLSQQTLAAQQEIQARYLNQYYSAVNKTKDNVKGIDDGAARPSRSRSGQSLAEAVYADVQARLAKTTQISDNPDDSSVARGEEIVIPMDTDDSPDEQAKEVDTAPRWDLSLQQKQPDAEVEAPASTLEITLPTELSAAPEPNSYVTQYTMLMTAEEAFYSCAVDQCLLCGSAGTRELMLMCVDCGECFHSFCVDAPLASMSNMHRREWRCTNCKLCDHCGTASETDTSPLLYCEECDRAFHGACLDQPVDAQIAASVSTWVCEACTCCKEPACMSKNSAAMRNVQDAALLATAKNHWGATADFCFPCKDQRDKQIAAEKMRKEAEEKERINALRQASFHAAEKQALCGYCSSNCANSYLLCRSCKRAYHPYCATVSVMLGEDSEAKAQRARSANILNSNWPIDNYHSSQMFNNYYCDICLHDPALSDVSNYELHKKVSIIQRQRLHMQTLKAQKALAEHEKVLVDVFEDHRPLLQAVVAWACERAEWLSSKYAYDFVVRQVDMAITDHVNRVTPMWMMRRARRFLSLYRKRSWFSKDMVINSRQSLARARHFQGGTEFSITVLTRIASMAAAFIAYTQKELDREVWQNMCLAVDHPLKYSLPHVNFPVIFETEFIVEMLCRYVNSGSILAGDFMGIQIANNSSMLVFEPATGTPGAIVLYDNRRRAQVARAELAKKLGLPPPTLPASQMLLPAEPVNPSAVFATASQTAPPASIAAPSGTTTETSGGSVHPQLTPPTAAELQKYSEMKSEYDRLSAARKDKLYREQARAKAVIESNSDEKKEAIFKLLIYMVEALAAPPCEVDVGVGCAVIDNRDAALETDMGCALKKDPTANNNTVEKMHYEAVTLPHTYCLPSRPRSSLLSKSTASAFPDPAQQPLPEMLRVWHKSEDGTFSKETNRNRNYLRSVSNEYIKALQLTATSAKGVESQNIRSDGSPFYEVRPPGKLPIALAGTDYDSENENDRIWCQKIDASGEPLETAAERTAKLQQQRISNLRLMSQHDVRFVSTCPTAGDSLLAVKSRKHRLKLMSQEEHDRELGTYDGSTLYKDGQSDAIAQNISWLDQHYATVIMEKDAEAIQSALNDDMDLDPNVGRLHVPEKTSAVLQLRSTQTEASKETGIATDANSMVLDNRRTVSKAGLDPSADLNEKERFHELSRQALIEVYQQATVDKKFATFSNQALLDVSVAANVLLRASQAANEQQLLLGPVVLEPITAVRGSNSLLELPRKRQRLEVSGAVTNEAPHTAAVHVATGIMPEHFSVAVPLEGFRRLNDTMPYEDTRFCIFCRKPEMAGEQAVVLGRLLPTGWASTSTTAFAREKSDESGSHRGQQYAHANCLRWSGEVFEKSGLLAEANGAKHRGLKTKCSHCGGKGATVSCNERFCRRTFHMECALVCRCALLEAVAYKVPPSNQMTRVPEHVLEENAQRSSTELHTFALCPEHAVVLKIPPNVPSTSKSVVEATKPEVSFVAGLASDTSAVPVATPPAVYERIRLNRLWQPSDPRRALIVHGLDYKVTGEAFARELAQGRGRQDGAGTAVRIGALSILHIGVPRIDLSGFHTERHIFPHGYRSSRIFWSMTRPLQRTLYVFEILAESDFEGTDSDLRDYEMRYALNYDPSVKDTFAAGAYAATSDTTSGHVPTSNKPLVDAAACPVFRVSIQDNPSKVIIARSIERAYEIITQAVHATQKAFLSQGFVARKGYGIGVDSRNVQKSSAVEVIPKSAEVSIPSADTQVVDMTALSANPLHMPVHNAPAVYGLNPYHFFGIGMPCVRKAIESMRESVAAVIAPPPVPQYMPVYYLPTVDDAFRLQQLQMSVKVQEPPSVEGSARADGIAVIAKRTSGTRVTKLLTKSISRGLDSAGASEQGTGAAAAASGSSAPVDGADPNTNPHDEEESKLIAERNRELYSKLSQAYLRDPNARIEVRKSHIHNWGLFTKCSFAQNEMIVEYIGEKIRQAVADHRENRYEAEGVGSCYLFRLDKDEIVDATRAGGMARFMNHCCEPNAYAKIVSTDEQGKDKHIIIFAARDIQAFEEITYDYKFPIEEKKLRCFCGASKCRGSMN